MKLRMIFPRTRIDRLCFSTSWCKQSTCKPFRKQET